jgi:hypothetical protein
MATIHRRMAPARTIRAIVLACVLTSAGCATENSIRQYLDNATASTITVGVSSAFARDRPEIAANLRDYIDVTPIEVNRGGRRTLYLICNIWSTIDRRENDRPFAANSLLSIVADGRVIALKSAAKTLREAGIGEQPVPTATKPVQVVLGELSVDALRTIANANQIYVSVTTNGVVDTYALWTDRRRAMIEFIAKLGRQ